MTQELVLYIGNKLLTIRGEAIESVTVQDQHPPSNDLVLCSRCHKFTKVGITHYCPEPSTNGTHVIYKR